MKLGMVLKSDIYAENAYKLTGFEIFGEYHDYYAMKYIMKDYKKGAV